MADNLDKLLNINATATVENMYVKQEMIESNFDISNSVVTTMEQELIAIKEENPITEHAMNNLFISRPMPGAVCDINSCLIAIKEEIYIKEESLVIANEISKSFLCNLCNFKSSSKSAVINHMEIHSGDYMCSICQYRTSQKDAFDTHIKLHSEERRYPCIVCEYQAKSKDKLDVHMRTHTREKLYSCSICEYKVAEKSTLSKHMMSHAGEQLYSCLRCEYKAKSKYNLVAHMRTHAGGKPPLKRAHKTLSLREKVAILDELKRGVTGKAVALKYGIGTSTISDIKQKQDEIKRHVSKCLTGPGDRKTLKKSVFPQMEKKLYRWFLLQRNRHVPIAPDILAAKALHFYKESYGDNDRFVASRGWIRKFMNRYGLRGLKIFGKKFPSNVEEEIEQGEIDIKNESPGVEHEMEVISQERPASGDSKSTCRSAVINHTEIHSGDYLCSICQYRTSQKDALDTHVKLHKEEKLFPCIVCGYQATSIDKFDIHMKTHTGEKPPLKRAHKTLSLREKLTILDELKRGATGKAIALKYGVGASTISNIKQKEDKIKRHVSNCLTGPGDRKTLKTSVFPQMEKKLHRWFLMQRNRHVPVSSDILAAKALQFYKESYGDNHRFAASRGWIRKFMSRYGLRGLKMSRETLPNNGEKPVNKEDEVQVQKMLIKHEDALKSFNMCCLWAEENNIDIADILVLNRLKEMAFEKNKTI